MNPSNHNTAPRQWYIRVDAQAYGPFTDQVLWDYMCEGRVTPQSLVSHHANGQYRLVSADPGLMNWMAQTPANKANAHQPRVKATAKRSVFVIMAEIRSGKGMEFLRMLQGLGQVERIGDSLWLLQTANRVEDIRDVLSQPLSSDDRVFILDSFENRTAWFNIGSEMDKRITDLWNIER